MVNLYGYETSVYTTNKGLHNAFFQPAITCSKLTIETLEQVSLLLTLNTFHILF